MFLSSGTILHVFFLTLLLIQLISCKLIQFKDGEIIYEYNDEDKIGQGTSSNVFKGLRKEGDQIEEVAFKVAKSDYDLYLMDEGDIYEVIGDHESFPKFYGLFSMTSGIGTILVTELLGNTLGSTSKAFENRSFSSVTVLKIGLQVLDALELMHRRFIFHLDVNLGNVAMGYKNDSKIYLFDFSFSEMYDVESDEWQDPSTHIQNDLSLLADMLIRFAQGKFLRDLDDEIDKNVDCRTALKEFLNEISHPKYNQVDYDELRRILQTELDKHKDEPNYDKLDWQIDH